MRKFNEFSMVITKAVLDKKSGQMRWSMSASDTGVDSYGDRTSLELFENFVNRIESEQEVPIEFKDAICEEDWCGGLPYVSISHLKSAGGQNVPGDVEKVYVDGNVLKAKGILHNDPLGFAVFQSLLADLYGESEYDDKIRVSIGFLDLKHSHGDFVFERSSVDGVCEKCLAGEGDKVFLDGQLVHLALTRKPANPRTDMEVEKMADVKTRKEDAESIVGKAQAELLVEKSSDALVEKNEEEVLEAEPTGEVVEEVEDSVATVEKSEDIEGQMYKAREEFYKAFSGAYPDYEYSYVMRVLDDAIIAEANNVVYKVPYTKTEDSGILFAARSEWKEVEFATKSAYVLEAVGLEKSAKALVAKAKELKEAGVVGEDAVRQLSELGKAVSTAIETEFTSPEQQMTLTVKSAVQDEVRAIVPEIVAELSKLFVGKTDVAPAVATEVPTPRSFQAKTKLPTENVSKKLSQVERYALKSVGMEVD